MQVLECRGRTSVEQGLKVFDIWLSVQQPMQDEEQGSALEVLFFAVNHI